MPLAYFIRQQMTRVKVAQPLRISAKIPISFRTAKNWGTNSSFIAPKEFNLINLTLIHNFDNYFVLTAGSGDLDERRYWAWIQTGL